MRLLVKIGGAQLEESGARADFARSVAEAREAGHEVAVVHGGGNQIRALVRRLGLPEAYHEGLRITDAETADVALMILGGLVNRSLVQALQQAGVPAVGLCGADGGLFHARRLAPAGRDLGYVGEVESIDKALAETLFAANYTPVIATVAPLAPGTSAPAEHFYNINADHAAGPLATALGADALLFLTDVPGVLDARGRLCQALNLEAVQQLQRQGVLQSGMLPKVQAALDALEVLTGSGTGALVKIAPALGTSAVLDALAPRAGTLFSRD